MTTELTTEYESLPAHSRNGSCFYSNSSNPFIQLMKQSFKRKIINDSSNSHINNDEEEEETTALGEPFYSNKWFMLYEIFFVICMEYFFVCLSCHLILLYIFS